MEIRTKNLSLNFYHSELLLFDIETTGLFWKRSHLCLIGFLSLGHSSCTLTQLFIESPLEEEQALRIFADAVSSGKTLLHFNGNSFDIPYIMNKCRFYQIELNLSCVETIDLYRFLHPWRRLLSLSSLKQKDAENLVCFKRSDSLSGRDIPKLYETFIQTGDRKIQDALFAHNQEDLLGMTALLPLLRLPEIFLEIPEQLSLTEAGESSLTINAASSICLPLTFHAKTEAFEFSYEEGSLTLSIKTIHTVLKLFFTDWKNYYYLPEEDIAIHKSVGQFVDRTHRKKATATTCYQKQEGIFVPVPKNFSDLPIFFEAYQSTPGYCLKKDLLQNPDLLKIYMQFALKELSCC